MIERKRKSCGWEFLFLGANIDAVETASALGIAEDKAANYCCDPAGTALNYEAVGKAITELRCNRPITSSWKEGVERDWRKRG
jgi:hypothetical protein